MFFFRGSAYGFRSRVDAGRFTGTALVPVIGNTEWAPAESPSP